MKIEINNFSCSVEKCNIQFKHNDTDNCVNYQQTEDLKKALQPMLDFFNKNKDLAISSVVIKNV